MTFTPEELSTIHSALNCYRNVIKQAIIEPPPFGLEVDKSGLIGIVADTEVLLKPIEQHYSDVYGNGYNV